MGSRFDAMFEIHSVAHMEFHGEELSVNYQDDSPLNVDLTAIVSPFNTVYREDESGHRVQVSTMNILISKDPDSVYGGVAQPMLAARFVINGEKWVVDLENDNAITATTGNYHQIALKSVKPMGRGYPGIESRAS